MEELIQEELVQILFVCLFVLGLHLQHLEVPRLGVELELQLLACAANKARPDLSSIHDHGQLTETPNP